MRIGSRLVSLILLCLLMLTAAPVAAVRAADITDFINEQTVIAAEADMTTLDANAIEAFLMELAKAAGVVGPNAVQLKEAEAKQNLAQVTRWINDAKQAGATSIYLVMDSAGIQQRFGPTIIIPVTDDKAAAIAKLIPIPQPPPGARAGPQTPTVATVPGVGVVFGATANVNAIEGLKPAPRPDLATAFKTAGAAPIKLAVGLDDELRQEMAKNMPPQILGKPSTLITKDFRWLSAAATPPPMMTVKAVVQSADANTAKASEELIVAAIVMNQQGRNKLPDHLITLLTPQVQGSQLVLSLDQKQINEIAVAMKEPLARARQAALRVQSMSNIRQILRSGFMHASQNKGEWPADMKELEKAMARFAGPNFKQLLINPARPDVQPAYVYIKPTKGINRRRTPSSCTSRTRRSATASTSASRTGTWSSSPTKSNSTRCWRRRRRSSEGRAFAICN